jgi:hypothetical protein
MAYAADEAASAVRHEADQAVRVALQEVLQKNEEVENARLGRSLRLSRRWKCKQRQSGRPRSTFLRVDVRQRKLSRPMLLRLVVLTRRSFVDNN